MAGYIGGRVAVSVPQQVEAKFTITATASQTSITNVSYTVGSVHVFQNGVRLVDGTDFTATNGSTVTLETGATEGDQIVIVSHGSFQTGDVVSKASGGTFSSAIAVDGSVTATSLVIPDGSLPLVDLDIDGGTDIGAALVDADLMIVDDGAGGTNRKATMSRLATYMNTKVGTAAAILPSNWASPDETFTSSATYSKHSSLADDDYIWFYVVSGGGGAGTHSVNAQGGLGGGAMLIYGKAGDFDQAVMVIGAGGAASTSQTRTIGGTSSLTLRANIGARAFSGLTDGPHSFNASAVGTYVAGAVADPYKFTVSLPVTVSGVAYSGSGFGPGSENVVGNFLFGGAAGGLRDSGSTQTAGNSLFGGAAGGSEAAAGSVPGGGGATDHQDSGAGGAGAAGNIRVYHVS